jgi:hypothetical protein
MQKYLQPRCWDAAAALAGGASQGGGVPYHMASNGPTGIVELLGEDVRSQKKQFLSIPK